VVVATRNRGKLKEILNLLESARLGFDLVTIDEIAPHAHLLENEATFEGNALAKARQAAAITSLPALADDSGLEVDALEGAPGVWSARYAGEPSDDAKNNSKLIAAISAAMLAKALPLDGCTARFRCVAAYVDPARGIEITRAGAVEGRVLTTPRGTEGHGRARPRHQEPPLPPRRRLSRLGGGLGRAPRAPRHHLSACSTPFLPAPHARSA